MQPSTVEHTLEEQVQYQRNNSSDCSIYLFDAVMSKVSCWSVELEESVPSSLSVLANSRRFRANYIIACSEIPGFCKNSCEASLGPDVILSLQFCLSILG